MTSIILTVTGAQAWALVSGPLTSGMVGIPVTIEYDEAWEALTKNLVCRCSEWGKNSGETRTILNVEKEATVAHEVMQPGMYLYLGIEGFSEDGKLVIPTTWARCGEIQYGANTGTDPSADPELPIWNQLQAEIEQINRDGITQERMDEILACAESANQAAAIAEKSEQNALAASHNAVSNANAAESFANRAQTYAENAGISASSAANLANGALQAQRAAEAAAERAEAVSDSLQNLNPVAKTADMTQPVGVDGDGLLWTAPGSGGDAADVLLGALPYTIMEPGCYLLSDVDAVVTSGDGSAQNLLTSVASNGYLVITAANVAYTGSVLTAELQEGTAAQTDAMKLYAGAADVMHPGQTYTVMYADRIGTLRYMRVLTATDPSSPAGNILVQITNTTGNTGAIDVGVLHYATITIPEDAAAVNLYFVGNDALELELYIFAGTHTEIPAGQTIQLTTGVPYSTDLLIGAALESDDEVLVYQKQTAGASGGFTGNTYIAFADSIWAFASVDGSERVSEAIAANLGCGMMNCAVGGTRLSGSRDSANEYYPYDMTQIADAIASGDFSAQIAGGKNAAFAQLQEINWAAVSGIVLAFGTNDFTAGTAFEGEDKTSVSGSLRYILDTILTARPTMRIFVTSTLRHVNIGGTVATHADGTVEDLNTLIRGICEEYGIPWIDMLHNFGSNAVTRMTLHGDGVHLNNATNAGKRYADVWCAQFRSKTMGIS